MTKKKKTSKPKTGPVWHMTAEEATLAHMPHFNAHACKTGAHGDVKYNRARQKRAWKSELDREGACRSRLLPSKHDTSGIRRALQPHARLSQIVLFPKLYNSSLHIVS